MNTLRYMLADYASGVAEVQRSTLNSQPTTKLRVVDGIVTGAILVMLAGYAMALGYWLVIRFLF